MYPYHKIAFRFCAWTIVAAVTVFATRAHSEESANPVIIWMGTTSNYMDGINATDVLAAYKTYANALARSRGLNATIEARLFDSLDALRRSVKEGSVDTVGLLTPDYFRTCSDNTLDLMFSNQVGGSIEREYVLLARDDGQESPIHAYEGTRALTYSRTQMGMARVWLEVFLADAGLPRAAAFFGSIEDENRLPRIVLPVYFGQADLCLVSRIINKLA